MRSAERITGRPCFFCKEEVAWVKTLPAERRADLPVVWMPNARTGDMRYVTAHPDCYNANLVAT